MRYPNWMGMGNEGRIEALLNIIGEPNAEALLRGELDAEFRPSARILFDHRGRRIPPRGLRSAVCDPDPNFYLQQPVVKLGERLARLVEFFPAGTKFLPEQEFIERIAALLERIQRTPQTANAVMGPRFPICLPQMEIADLGEFVEVCVEAAGRSYEQQFPGRNFYNHRRGMLARQVTVVDESHKQLLERLGTVPLCGILTVPLQGYSVYAQRGQMAGLPEHVSLGGGVDPATAVTGYPETLARDFNTPRVDMSALQWQSPEYSLDFGSRGGGLDFGSGGDLGGAFGYCSGGLFFLG